MHNHDAGRRARSGSPRIGPTTTSSGGSNRLKALLVASDALAVFVAFSVTLGLSSFRNDEGIDRVLIVSLIAVVAGLLAIQSQGLFLARVNAFRLVEITKTTRAMVMLAGAMLLIDRIGEIRVSVRHMVPACIVALVALIVSRSAFRSWLQHARLTGRYRRRVAIVGTDDGAQRLVELFETHRELGVEVVGVLGDADTARANGIDQLLLGDLDDVEETVAALATSPGLSGVIIVPGGLSPARTNGLVRALHTMELHVQLATGISGIDARRFRPLPVAHEPMLYVEAPSLARGQMVAKRCFDVVAAGLALLVLSPILFVVALAVRLGDGGPVLFTQTRIGRDGTMFGVLKFRSMAVDAEARLAALQLANERSGPLFKMERDPRVTRVGRFLRESSVDELPQLINVLRGEMSLVGPRPALPSEVANFPPGLRQRERVLPGITGLWQVEARDNPSFEAYRRLDLFYVENWSITLDLLIIIGTIEQTIARLLTTLLPSRSETRETATTDPETGTVVAEADRLQRPGPAGTNRTDVA